VNEQNKTIADLWNGENLKYIFKRCVDVKLFNLWEELVSLVTTIEFSGEKVFKSSRVYSSQSLYSVINFRGVIPIYIPAV
jgi:hypothetical protein